MNNNLIITCPACGFSFKPVVDSRIQKKIIECPMCGYTINESEIFPQELREFDKKII